MTERSLQITYRKGRPFAAYLYLSRMSGVKTAKTEATQDRLLVIDYAADGRPIGIEIVAPDTVTVDRLNALLEALGQAPLAAKELSL